MGVPGEIREEGETMSQKKLRPVIVAGAVVLMLTTGSAWAGTRGTDTGGGFWQWLASAWNGGISAMWAGIDQGPGSDPNGGLNGDQGPGSDPNGSVNSGDQGPGTDPNGGRI